MYLKIYTASHVWLPKGTSTQHNQRPASVRFASGAFALALALTIDRQIQSRQKSCLMGPGYNPSKWYLKGFLNWGTPKSSKSLDHDLVLKPMVLGIPCVKKPQKPQLGFLGETNIFDSSITIAQNNVLGD